MSKRRRRATRRSFKLQFKDSSFEIPSDLSEQSEDDDDNETKQSETQLQELTFQNEIADDSIDDKTTIVLKKRSTALKNVVEDNEEVIMPSPEPEEIIMPSPEPEVIKPSPEPEVVIQPSPEPIMPSPEPQEVIMPSPEPEVVFKPTPAASPEPLGIEKGVMKEIPQKLVKRVTNSLEVAVNIDQDTLEKKEQKPNRLIEILKAMFIPSESPLQTKRTDFLIRARKIGFKMIPQLLFPALPKLARDIWVFGEFFITLFQFLFALISTNYRTSVNRLFTGIYLTLSTINFILACIDAFLYFYELGSCRSIFESLKEMRNKKQKATANEIALEELQQEEIVELENKKVYYKWIRLSEKRKQQLNIWFELIRTILSELLIYPLIIFDLFDAVGIGFVDDKQNLSLFVIGSFYLVLAVYIARVAMSIMTLLTLRRLLLHSKTSPSNIRFILRFLIHIITQVIVHISCVIAVGIKIRQENSGDGESYNASPILWAVMIGGWVIPFLGVVSFFIVNYYWMQQFATGIYVEMISLLQTPSVAESLFQSKSEMSQETEERSKQFLEKMQHKKVQEEYENEVDTTSRFSKLIHPLKVPGFIFLCILYNLFLGTFLACLLLTYDNGNVSVVSLDEFEGIALVVLIIIITIANIHIMFLTIFSFVLIIIVFIIIALLPGMCAIPLFHALSIVVKKLRQSNEPSHNSEITSHE